MTDHPEPLEAPPASADATHAALCSLMEEIQAVDLYQSRFVACTEPELKRTLAHNRDEEMEHAAMLLEWLRRTTPQWDRVLRTYLFTTAPITELEGATTGAGDAAGAPGLGIGSLKGR